MFVTELTFQLEISKLKIGFPANMAPISITDPTFQFDISELKLFAS